MNPEEMLTLANFVDGVHVVFIAYLFIGFFVFAAARRKLPRFTRFFALSSVCTLGMQILLGFRCPLVLISEYLRALARGESFEGAPNLDAYKPFIVTQLKERFGFDLPDMIVTIGICVLGTVCLTSLSASAHRSKQKNHATETPHSS